MNELSAKLKRPMDKTEVSNDRASLGALVALLNTPAITGAVVEKELPAPPLLPPSASVEVTLPPPTPVKQDNTQKLFFTGRLKSGKDFCAKQAGCHIEGFANPLYAITNYFFGTNVSATEGKDIPGVREFLQRVGNWGRAEVTAAYPLSAERAVFQYLIRTLGELDILGDHGVDWARYGSDSMLWVNAATRRIADYLAGNPGGRVAVTNVRYANEYHALTEAGYTHFHCMCSPQTWAKRLSPMLPTHPSLSDLSEQMAAKLDANVIQQISRHKEGHKLHCLWADETVPSPSKRLYSIDEFLAHLKQSDGAGLINNNF